MNSYSGRAPGRALSSGDDRLRRERLVPECEPSGADLVNSAQNIKCQQHFLCCHAARCISDRIDSTASSMRPRPPSPISARCRVGRDKGGVPHMTLLNVRKTSRWPQGYLPAEIPAVSEFGRLRS